MDTVAAVQLLGGVGSTAQIIALSSRRKLRTSIERGDVQRIGRGRYVLDGVRRHRLRAVELSGTLSHLCAAQHWQWPVKVVPESTWVTVPRNRKVGSRQRAGTELFYADLASGDVIDGVTSPLRTVIDCARALPFDEALAVADSALRERAISDEELRTAAAAARGPGSARLRRVAGVADARAANPFESVLRAIVLTVGGLDVVPQAPVTARGLVVHPDLVDLDHRVVLEADSWGFHADKETHGRDCVRYTALAVEGWVVLRFTWEQVMHSPAYVRAVLEDLVARRCWRAFA